MAATATIRVDQQTRDALVKLADKEHMSIGAVVREAVDKYRRDQFFAQVREELNRLKANPEEWADYQAELASMDGTLLDGLEDLPW
jgi:predicted transcriptional regulator